MKRKIAYMVYVLMLSSSFVLAQQNLVRNPELDTMLWCPMNLQQLGDPCPIAGWFEEGTADYYNACNTGIVNAPNAYFGFAAGDAFAGFLGAVYYPDTSLPSFNFEYIKTALLAHIAPGTEIRLGAHFFRGTVLPGFQGPTSSVLFILSPLDTIQTPLLDQSQWATFDTTIVLQGRVDTLKIGAGGAIGPYNGSPYSGYYYIDSIFLEVISLPVSIDSPGNNQHVWEDISLVAPMPFYVQRCTLHGERRKVVKVENE